MKTGLSASPETSIAHERFYRRIVSIISVLVTRAQESAITYAEHAVALGRPDGEVTWVDIAMALRYNCYHFMRDDFGKLQQDTDAMETRLTEVLVEMGYTSFDDFMHKVKAKGGDAEDTETSSSEGDIVSAVDSDDDFAAHGCL